MKINWEIFFYLAVIVLIVFVIIFIFIFIAGNNNPFKYSYRDYFEYKVKDKETGETITKQREKTWKNKLKAIFFSLGLNLVILVISTLALSLLLYNCCFRGYTEYDDYNDGGTQIEYQESANHASK